MVEAQREVFIEYARIGSVVRVTAVDAASGTEIVFQAPATASPVEMKQIAIRKLKYVMNKQEKP